MAHPAVSVLEWQLVVYRRTWRAGLFGYFVIPVLFLLGIGLGLGGYVDQGGRLGVDYLAYIAPGLMVASAMGIAAGEATWPVLAYLKWNQMYQAMLATPLRVWDVLVGHVSFVVFRTLLASAAYLLVMLVAGAVRSPWALLALPVAGLVGLATAAPVFAFTARQEDDAMLSVVQRFVIVPVSLFSGVFFPISQLPAAVRPLAWLFPLWHGVELSRGLSLGRLAVLPALGHVAVLLAWSAAGLAVAHAVFRRRLVW